VPDEYGPESEDRVLRGVGRWAVILRAVGILNETNEAEYFRRPWTKDIPGGYQAHRAWVKAGKPGAPGENGYDEARWESFISSLPKFS
jgi:hypothetical protein